MEDTKRVHINSFAHKRTTRKTTEYVLPCTSTHGTHDNNTRPSDSLHTNTITRNENHME